MDFPFADVFKCKQTEMDVTRINPLVSYEGIELVIFVSNGKSIYPEGEKKEKENKTWLCNEARIRASRLIYHIPFTRRIDGDASYAYRGRWFDPTRRKFLVDGFEEDKRVDVTF